MSVSPSLSLCVNAGVTQACSSSSKQWWPRNTLRDKVSFTGRWLNRNEPWKMSGDEVAARSIIMPRPALVSANLQPTSAASSTITKLS